MQIKLECIKIKETIWGELIYCVYCMTNNKQSFIEGIVNIFNCFRLRWSICDNLVNISVLTNLVADKWGEESLPCLLSPLPDPKVCCFSKANGSRDHHYLVVILHQDHTT